MGAVDYHDEICLHDDLLDGSINFVRQAYVLFSAGCLFSQSRSSDWRNPHRDSVSTKMLRVMWLDLRVQGLHCLEITCWYPGGTELQLVLNCRAQGARELHQR